MDTCGSRVSKPGTRVVGGGLVFCMSLVAAACLFSVRPAYSQHECCGASGAAMVPDAPTGGAGGIGVADYGDAAACELTDSMTLLLRTFGNFSYSITPDGHRGDPLGTGGKMPLAYNIRLYREGSIDQPSLLRRDLRIQYQDPGYLPVWRNNIVYNFVRMRLGSGFYGNLGVTYGGELGQPGTAAPNQFGIGEAALVWMPDAARGLTLRAGNVLDIGNYCGIYNQTPAENFIYTGLIASYYRQLTSAVGARVELGGGGTTQGTTPFFQDTVDASAIYLNSYIRSTRNRTYLNGKTILSLGQIAQLKVSGGLQYVPADSIEGPALLTNPGRRMYERTLGWFAGTEAVVGGPMLRHNLSLTYGKGDVLTGSGSPLYVRYSNATSFGTVEWLSRAESSFAAGAFWSTLSLQRFSLGVGLWGIHHMPASNPITEYNRNQSYYLDSATVVALEQEGLSTDSVLTLDTDPFSSLKFSVFPSVKISGPLYAGLRLDGMGFPRPDARTNTQDPYRDQTLRVPGEFQARIDNPSGQQFYEQARWEREAVDAVIVTPQLSLVFPGVGGMTLAYSQGWYEKPIDRQGRIARAHGNLTASAFVNYQIVKE